MWPVLGLCSIRRDGSCSRTRRSEEDGETTKDLEELSTWEERVDYEENQNAGGAA